MDCIVHNYQGGLGLGFFTFLALSWLGFGTLISVWSAIAVLLAFLLKMLFFLWRIRRGGG